MPDYTLTAVGSDGVPFAVSVSVAPGQEQPWATVNSAAALNNAVASAPAGALIWLAQASFGSWSGTSKPVTLRPAPGATPSMSLNLGSGASGFTVDGRDGALSIGASRFTGSPRNVTLRGFRSTGTNVAGGLFEFDGPISSGILIEGAEFHHVNGGEAAIRFSYSGNSGVTIRRTTFRDMDADGVKLGAQATIEDCRFLHVRPSDPAQHTDAIQIYGGTNCVIRRCLFYDFEQACAAFDGTHDNLVEGCVFHAAGSAAHWLTMMADSPGSTLRHNTLAGPGGRYIYLSSKPGGTPSRTFVRDNIAASISLSGSGVTGQPSENRNNMLSSASGQNFAGTPVFVGGPAEEYESYRLAPGSPGKGRATDGTDVGI